MRWASRPAGAAAEAAWAAAVSIAPCRTHGMGPTPGLTTIARPGYGYGYGSGYWRNGIWYSGESYVEPYVVQRPIVENPVVFSGGPIKITNPATNRAALSYSLNGMVYTIQPGFSQEFAEDRDWVIDFSRGPNLGAGRYSLHTGLYSFGAGGNGWELFSVPVDTSPAGGLASPPPPKPSATVNPLPGTPATIAPTP